MRNRYEWRECASIYNNFYFKTRVFEWSKNAGPWQAGRGGLSEWPTLTPLPPRLRSCGQSVFPATCQITTFVHNHTFCSYLQFSVWVDFDEIENLLAIPFEENFTNNCFRFSFSPKKSLARSTTYYCCGCGDISCNCLHMRMRGFVLLKSFLFLHCIFQLENWCFVKARSALD